MGGQWSCLLVVVDTERLMMLSRVAYDALRTIKGHRVYLSADNG